MIVTLVQMSPAFMKKDQNLERMIQYVEEAARHGSHFVVFPECCLSGFQIETIEEAMSAAETIPGPASEALKSICREKGSSVVFGLVEKEENRLYNTAALLGPEGVVGRHRKAHIGPIGVDALVTPGQRLDVFDVSRIRVGLLICYECRFPEAARALALKGAQIIVIIANHPSGAEVNPKIMSPARAAENHVYVLHVNRSGSEGPITYFGNSVIVGPDGSLLASASKNETILRAEIHPQQSGLGRVDVSASGYTLNLLEDRRPDLYGILLERDSASIMIKPQ